MPQKVFNFVLAIVFISLVAMFAYKSVTKPQVLTASVKKSSDSINGNSLSKAEIQTLVKEYIRNNPEDIIASLEGMQKKKIVESAERASKYLVENRKNIEEVDSPPIIGDIKGDISVVVFYDYNCSFCRQANEFSNEILASDPGVKVILRPIPILGGTSMYAAKVALAVQKISKEKFQAIHNDMMKLRPLNEDSVKKLMAKYDIDYSLVENEVNSYAIKQLITKNFELAKGLGIKGAPSHVINGNYVPGLITVDKFKTIILQIRASSDKDLEK